MPPSRKHLCKGAFADRLPHGSFGPVCVRDECFLHKLGVDRARKLPARLLRESQHDDGIFIDRGISCDFWSDPFSDLKQGSAKTVTKKKARRTKILADHMSVQFIDARLCGFRQALPFQLFQLWFIFVRNLLCVQITGIQVEHNRALDGVDGFSDRFYDSEHFRLVNVPVHLPSYGALHGGFAVFRSSPRIVNAILWDFV
jgi:hypothetical protein